MSVFYIAHQKISLLLLPLLWLALMSCDGLRQDVHSASRFPQVVNPDFTGSFYDPQQQRFWIWGTDASLRWSPDGHHWNRVALPGTQAVKDFLLQDASALVLMEDGTLYRSADEGISWVAVYSSSHHTGSTALAAATPNPAEKDLSKLVYLPESQRIYLLGETGYLPYSSDTGKTWEVFQLPSSYQTQKITALGVTSHHQRLLLGGESGLLGVSDDMGKTWSFHALQQETPVTAFYAFNKTLVASSTYGVWWVSQDEGNSWERFESDGQAYFTGGFYLAEDDTFFMTAHNGKLLRGTEGATQWQMLTMQFRAIMPYLSAIAFDPLQQSLHVLGTAGAHFVSTDAGKTWKVRGESALLAVDHFAFKADHSVWIGYGRGGALALSNNQGQIWQPLAPRVDMYLRELMTTPAGNWLAVGDLGMILRSDDRGNTWHSVTVAYRDPNTPPAFRAILVEPETQSIVAAGPTGTIMRSRDDGRSWRTVYYSEFDQGEAFTDLLYDSHSGNLFALEAWGRHKRSVDGGLQWESVSAAMEQTDTQAFWQITAMPLASSLSLWMAAGRGGLVASSDDQGSSWHYHSTDPSIDWYGIFAHVDSRQWFLLGSNGALQVSQDNGKHWRVLETHVAADLRRMIAVNQQVLLALGGEGVILRSEDAGIHWQQIASGIHSELRKGVIDTQGHIYVAAADGYLLRSMDEGKTWSGIATSTSAGLRGLLVDQDNVLAAGERLVMVQK